MKLQINSPSEPIAAFVAAHPSAEAAHMPVWLEILEAGLGHRPRALSAWRDGQVVGYLPLAETRSLLFGRHLVSLPYVNKAGLLADEPATAEALIEAAADLGKRNHVRYIELRNARPVEAAGLRGVRADKVGMVLRLPDAVTELWDQIPSKVRNQVRKAERHDFHIHWGGKELVDRFYRVFAVNMRDLGSPAFPRKLFAAMAAKLGSELELCVVMHGEQGVAGAVLVHHRQTTEVPSASSLRQWNHTCVNMLMYHHLLQRAIVRGSTVFDFGRSTVDSGTYRFKSQWGAVAQPMCWSHVTDDRAAEPLRREDDRFGLAIEVWKRLPVWVTRMASGVVVRGIP